MATNQVQEAVEAYERVVKKAANDYEDILRKAELDLKAAIGPSELSGPPDGDYVKIARPEYEKLQVQLDHLEKVIKAHPDIFKQ